MILWNYCLVFLFAFSLHKLVSGTSTFHSLSFFGCKTIRVYISPNMAIVVLKGRQIFGFTFSLRLNPFHAVIDSNFFKAVYSLCSHDQVSIWSIFSVFQISYHWKHEVRHHILIRCFRSYSGQIFSSWIIAGHFFLDILYI